VQHKKGGKRPNSGRPAKFGDLPTQRLVRIVPTEWVERLDAWLLEQLEQEKLGG
jgi:hypothetical protein